MRAVCASFVSELAQGLDLFEGVFMWFLNRICGTVSQILKVLDALMHTLETFSCHIL